jgi:hypothetical protein
MEMNRFLSLLERARQNRWCTRPLCTTCGATDFRRALRHLGGPDRAELANELANLDLTELEDVPAWGTHFASRSTSYRPLR